MQQIQNYVQGEWVSGQGEELIARDAIHGTEIGIVSSAGLDYEAILDYGRKVGGPALRKNDLPGKRANVEGPGPASREN